MSYLGVALGDYKYLDPTHPGSEIDGGILYAGWPLDAFHRGWFDFARLTGWEATAWGYDFRNSTIKSAVKLAGFLEFVARDADEVAVVAHSMGGLVTARAWELIPRKIQGKFTRFATLGTPWEGSYSTLSYLCGVGPTLENIAFANSYGNKHDFIRNKIYLKELLARWPGVYDLLPSPDLIGAYNPGRELEPWRAESWEVSNPTVDQRLLNTSRHLHEQPYQLLPGMLHLCITGTGFITPGPLPVLGHQGYYMWKFTVDGDDVVPGVSSTSPFGSASRSVAIHVDHMSMPNNELCHWHIKQFLQQG